MKKMLIIMTMLDAGGAERSLINFLNTYDRSKYQVDLLLFKKKGCLLKYVPQDVKIIDQERKFFYLYNFSENFWDNLRNLHLIVYRFFYTMLYKKNKQGSKIVAKQLRWDKYIRVMEDIGQEYDVAMAYLDGEPVYYLADKVRAKRRIGWIHNDYVRIMGDRDFDAKRFAKLDQIVSISPKCVEVLKENFPQLSDRITELENINSKDVIDKLAEEYYPSEYNYDGAKILSVGRLTKQKAFERIVPITKELIANDLKFRWFVLGDGVLGNELKAQVEAEGLADYIVYLGVRDNPYPYMKNADVIVQTSLFEGKSVVLDECKILHKKIVATEYNTVYDQVGDYPVVVVKPDAKELADRIVETISNDITIDTSKRYDNVEQIEEYYKVIDGIR